MVVAGGVALSRFMRLRQPKQVNPAPESLILTPETDIIATRTADGAVHIRWTEPLGEVKIYSGVKPDDIATDTPLATTEAQEVTLTVLDPKLRHYFVLQSDVGRFMVAERVFSLEGAVNFRDLGGYMTEDGRRVRWGCVYRSGTLTNLTDGDLDLLTSGEIKLICDLRTDEEVADEPDRVPDGATYRHIPVRNENAPSRLERLVGMLFKRSQLQQILQDTYTRVTIDENPDVIGDILNAITDKANLPMVIHCAAGKDRTGIVSAILLAVLGVPDETIIADYTLSNHYYENFREIADRAIGHMNRLGFSADSVYPFLVADANTLRVTLNHIRDTYGSIESYLNDKAGVSIEAQGQLRDMLLV